jgi:hypothetical protein
MQTVKNKFNVLHINIRSCSQNFNQFLCYLLGLDIKYDIVVISETWIISENENLFNIPGYMFCSQNRDIGRGGGLRIYFLSNLVCNKIDELSIVSETHESLFVKITEINRFTYIIGAFYRPPRCKVTSFNNYIENILYTNEEILSSKCILLGDFNINLIKEQEKQLISNFVDVMTEGGFSQLVNNPTRCESGIPVTLIDHIWINFSETTECSVLDYLIADHLPIQMSIACNRSVHTRTLKKKFRQYSRENFVAFDNDKIELFGSYNIMSSDVNVEMNKFVKWIMLVVNKYFPYNVKNLSEKRMNMPWLNREAIDFINFKHKLFIKTKRKLVPYSLFKAYSALLKILIERLKRNYFKRKFLSNKGDSKLIWKSINDVLGRACKVSNVQRIIASNDIELTSPDLIAKEFNIYFNSIANITQSRLDNPKKNYENLVPINNTSMFLIPTTPGEVLKTIDSLNAKKSSDLPVKFIKYVGTEISSLLSNLFNLCFRNGCYPDLLKNAKIVPIFKTGNSGLLGNYRPISILPIINKILEKLIYKRLESFFQSCSIISCNQFGFRKNKDTTQATLKIIDTAIRGLDNDVCSACVFLDYSKAFDTVCHALLLTKLERYGVRGHALALITSYLSDRKHYVYVNGSSSDALPLRVGVPQGS